MTVKFVLDEPILQVHGWLGEFRSTIMYYSALTLDTQIPRQSFNFMQITILMLCDHFQIRIRELFGLFEKVRHNLISTSVTGQKYWFKEIEPTNDEPTKAKTKKQLLPENLRKMFANKHIVCTEYTGLTSVEERDIFSVCFIEPFLICSVLMRTYLLSGYSKASL